MHQGFMHEVTGLKGIQRDRQFPWSARKEGVSSVQGTTRMPVLMLQELSELMKAKSGRSKTREA